jgi:hypothetical protein|tara:strand:- start:627 stop:1847 length:1221 start_codon:yes stop_codon:yes gene_type:complete
MVVGSYMSLGERVREAVQRITFEPPPPPSVFIKPPRATARVLEFRKTPVPRGSYQQRKTKVAQTRVQQVQAMVAMRTDNLLNQLDASKIAPPSLRRGARMGVGGGTGSAGGSQRFALALPTLSDVEVRGVKESTAQVDMNLDMLSIKDMDTGQYQAMVIQDPDDRRKISGYIHLAQAFTQNRTVAGSGGHESGNSARLTSQITRYENLDFLIKALDEYTGIEADYLGPIPLDDPRINQVPWLMLPSWFGEVHSSSEKEIESLGYYLAHGGFALTTSGPNEKLKGSRFDRLRDALSSQGLYEGQDWRFTYLKPSHPIYHSYFDFDMAVRDNMGVGNVEVGDMGLVIGDRLAVLFTIRQVTTGSAREGTNNFELAVDGTRHLQFTVNTVVFALTQEGGVTQQLMAGIK